MGFREVQIPYALPRKYLFYSPCTKAHQTVSLLFLPFGKRVALMGFEPHDLRPFEPSLWR